MTKYICIHGSFPSWWHVSSLSWQKYQLVMINWRRPLISSRLISWLTDWLWFLHWKPGGLMDIIESKHAVMRRCVWPGQLYCITDKWQGHHGFMLLSCCQIFSEPPRSSMFSFLARWRGQGMSHHRSDWACLPWDLSAPIFSEVSAVQCRAVQSIKAELGN